MADLVRYHVNVYWENARDRRTSRTLDWLNDACEARINKDERHDGRVTYAVLMSPVSISFSALSFEWKHPFAHSSRAKLRLSKREYTKESPISLLVATKPHTVAAGGATREPEPNVLLLGMKKRLGRRAVVRRCTGISRLPKDGDFNCRLKVSTATIDVGFATKFEVDTLFKYLNLSSEAGAEPTEAESTP